ncbi:hypothetical protein K438DRAFT_1831390 [Mycena galopus ATCC 62051]|nr:hypothetical protein K438DRAFT_1831390 [Mycena galopus ATCC 62051]
MLPFGLKLVWFALSLSGLIGCWAVLLPLAWAIQSYWGPIAYAVGITVLEGVFCLGLVWRMNPANIPRGFCLAQVLFTGLATFILIGVLAAITTATTIYIAKPKQWGMQEETAKILPWKFHYLLPMVLFPLLASAVQVTFVVFFDTFEPFDGLNCVSHPLWLRFIGYAGPPFLITLPCLWLSSLSLVRVIRTHNHIRRARRSVHILNLDHFTALPQRRSKQSMKTHSTPPTPRAITAPSPSASLKMRMANDPEPRRQPVSPVLRERSYHLPFLPPSPDYLTAHSGSRRSDDTFDTVSNVSFAEITPKPTRDNTPNSKPTRDNSADEATPLYPANTPNGTTRSTDVSRSIHNSDRISITQIAFALQREEIGDSTDYYSCPSMISSVTPNTQQTEHKSPSKLSSVVRSLLIFQL